MSIIAPDPLALYCDASGNESESIFVVGGAISTVENWRQFDTQWRAALAEDNLKYFRMSEFAQSTRQFKKGWKNNETRRRDLLQRLVSITIAHVKCWVGRAAASFGEITMDANRVYQLEEYLQPYPLCAEACIDIAREWQNLSRLDYLPMEYVFESGDEHWGQLRNRIKEDYGHEPLLRKKTQATPLQLADFAAYEVRKAYVGLDAENAKLFERFRASFSLIGTIQSKWGTLGATAIRTEMNLRGVTRRNV